MSAAKQVARFRKLLEKVFSRDIGKVDIRNPKDQDLFHEEYVQARKIVLSVRDAKFLTELMNAYLEAYASYAKNPGNIRYYKSDQLFDLLIEQTRKLNDETLYDDWMALLYGPADTDLAKSFQKRYAELDGHWQSQIKAFREREKKARRERRSILDLLKSEYARQRGQPPKTNDELYAFDPGPNSLGAELQLQIEALTKVWGLAKGDCTKKNIELLDDALLDFKKFALAKGKDSALSLFQIIKELQVLFADKIETRTDPKTGQTEIHRTTNFETRDLYYGLYAIACIQLMVVAKRDKQYSRNRLGFTQEEVAYFYKPVETNRYYYRSNIREMLEPPLKDPDVKFGVVKAFLGIYLLTENQLQGLYLVDRDKTLEIQKKWDAVRDLTGLIRLASSAKDEARLNEIFADPRNNEAIGHLKEMCETTIETQNPQFLGRTTLAAGSSFGSHGKYGDISIVYINPANTNQIYIEFSGLKPNLFLAPQYYVDNKFYGEQILTIYKSTIGIVHITELIFMAMGFLPVLIEAGFAGLIYEIAVFYVGGKVEEQAARINPTFGKALGLLIQTFTPRPNFKPKINAEAVERPEATGLSDVLNVPGRDKSLLDRAVSSENQGIGHLNGAELETFVSKIPVMDEVMQMHSGLPLRPGDLKRYIEGIETKGRFPVEWKTIIGQSEPLRKLLNAAEEVRLVKISEKQMKGLPFKYQKSSMGSQYELHFTLDGREYKLDGIIVDGSGKTWIGESKFTFKDAFEHLGEEKSTMTSFDVEGKANPTTSYHYRFLDEKVLPQFDAYAKLAKRFGFEGVAVYANTEFLWATFEQVTRYKKYIEVFLQEFEYAAPKVTRPKTGRPRASAR